MGCMRLGARGQVQAPAIGARAAGERLVSCAPRRACPPLSLPDPRKIMPRPIHVALIGQKFMGRAHSNAWNQVGRFFDGPRPVHLHTVAARDKSELIPFARRWGWEHCSDNWRSLAALEEVELVDLILAIIQELMELIQVFQQ